MWATAGEEVTLNLNFKLDGQFVIPDAGSLKVTIRDNSGAVLPDWNKASVESEGKTQQLLTLPSALTFVPSSSDMEARYLSIEWTVLGTHCTMSEVVKLVPFIPIQANPNMVRNLLGATDEEIPDSDIDIYEAYFKLLSKYPEYLPLGLRSARASACYPANRAVALTAALIQVPALGAKLSQSETHETYSLVRMKVNMEELKKELTTLLASAVSDMLEALTGSTSEVNPTLLSLSTPTDVITG
jgi:hypothetical protein